MNKHWSTLERLKDNYRLFFNQVFQCELCQGQLDNPSFICTACYSDLPFQALACPQCSEPVYQPGRCGSCQQRPPAFDYSHCSYLYQHPMQHWLHRCKDKGDIRFVRLIAELMLKAQPVINLPPDALVFVPSTRKRLVMRGFNLSLELTRQMSKELTIPIISDSLLKIQHTEQRRLAAKDRRLRDTCLRSGQQDLKGKHLLIIDDVMTTGSTLDQAAKLLKQQGAETVGAWCFARTPKA